ncbi:MAG: hypothetical protein A3B91_03430 [Candidatus Yanofskybacteria bacterium RIFCSPHIGHO2_02_FULL_41_29]|uniref:ATP-dependent zinc metalloprotease FtsH n=1 Tax=Candidatus Yanofskybacteria bacterium RIFCSPHIGHO2_01_FULL_41_53 TaxID=1802663 RepID=A0A1F8EI49_9BACT|nr:MAG: hypothetical protein A2650_01255 [Candidatus Yanofskybacteria bacterium RIFCSPHIGHO2_01_FULL_41_53]OGN10710.1 MAG: hypothetical protein A3B91_03430 [Candidatus Yanofskybacteria bacterium RIFCSPHIGHO2_02_FULL_41_29]OGN24032.1 MAG: hypothetical protein A2916_04700 [Candidatus Yanofskybacteria bacterium RIFCSPLOWO2_01_FULL_41_67]OGN30508.1 MAG: hypothetical protein A3H54_00600 [Candidatus Yanofskybacteria bacterium RIFCSPLOWO2_02_FULL_41_13]
MRKVTIAVLILFAYVLVILGKFYFIGLSVMTAVIIASIYAYRSSTGMWPWEKLRLIATGAGDEGKGPEISESTPKVTFDDVAGIDEAIEDLNQIVDFLRNKDRYTAVGAKLPSGVMLVGPPGVGKTLCAKAIAGEAGVTMIEVAASSFVEKYVGIGASKIRELFARAKSKAPCILFIDEFDSLGKRGEGDSGGDREYDQTINQFLVEMDGFSSKGNVMVLAATNRIDKIDEAILRPGRFDRTIYIDRPDVKGREAILKVHAKNKTMAEDVDLKYIAKLTPGFTGADLANILNEGAINAGKKGKKDISQEDILAAKERIVLGKERKSLVIDAEDKKIVAYHESGHALLAVLLKNVDLLDKVTIIPRDRALGITALTPGKDRYNVSKDFLCDQMVMLFGGRAAEKIACQTETAGASNDIERATAIATAMVCDYGMSSELGPISISASRSSSGMGNLIFQEQAQNEIIKLLKESYAKAEKILTDNVDKLHVIAKLLLEKEAVSGEEIVELVNKKP